MPGGFSYIHYHMRIFLFVFCIYSVQGLTQTAFPFDFETSETTPVFYDFEQAATTVVPNPNVNDNNPSATVAKMVRNTGGQIWAGSLVQFDEYFDFTEIGAIKMSVHAPVSGSVIKLSLRASRYPSWTLLQRLPMTGKYWNGILPGCPREHLMRLHSCSTLACMEMALRFRPSILTTSNFLTALEI